ncbi:membrane-bound lytic murein transglycosylase A [Faunimonas pinastri]|uniref:peptidoglycan lytic exotransglycosylase n=1 Tax=Faunimonas pinastri TaxID=1855383 RepID=A0A1H9GXJ3_9HYPH|nr:MltA domain-containing protein [Faunimonas pinastri]SEQ54767.1 membrane-bound lytic murein transglycosylase A [Faunimonas pinastri]
MISARPEKTVSPGADLLRPVRFDTLPGWAEDDHAAAYRAFHRSAERAVIDPPSTKGLGVDGTDLVAIARRALQTGPTLLAEQARAFFERWFAPFSVAEPGFVTGYYEPEVDASAIRTPNFPVPLYCRPPDLVNVTDTDRPAGWDREIRFARQTTNGLEMFSDRRAIEEGALAGLDLEIAWLRDPVDAYFVHIQGSARLSLQDGRLLRVSFAGKSGHAYTSIGKLAIARGLLLEDKADKSGLEAWLRTYPDRARDLMRENRSFIFFAVNDGLAPSDGPLGAAGVSLTPGRSLAVDRMLGTFHTPVFVTVSGVADPERTEKPFRRLMIAQDTGSAIVGPSRGDLFFGSGDAAGRQAGRVRHAAEMVLLVPRPGPAT